MTTTACKSCGAYGGSQHSRSCFTISGQRNMRQVQPHYVTATFTLVARKNAMYGSGERSS